MTRPAAKKAIQKQGFSGKARTREEGFAGDYFGAGTYVHTEKSHSDQYLSGVRMAEWGDEVQVRTQTKLRKPFKITATENDVSPGDVMRRAMIKAGYAKPGESLSGPEITRRLKTAGYDGVDLRQSRYNHDVTGSQIVVFDPKDVRIRPGKKDLLKKVAGRKAEPKRTGTPGKTSRVSPSADTLAERYHQMHGTDGANKKLQQLRAKKSPTARDRELAASLEKVVGKRSEGKDDTGVSPREQKIRTRIESVYSRLQRSSDGWASITDLRRELPQVKPDELGEILKKLDREGKIALVPESNRKVLTESDHNAAVRVGGEDNHLFRFH